MVVAWCRDQLQYLDTIVQSYHIGWAGGWATGEECVAKAAYTEMWWLCLVFERFDYNFSSRQKSRHCCDIHHEKCWNVHKTCRTSWLTSWQYFVTCDQTIAVMTMIFCRHTVGYVVVSPQKLKNFANNRLTQSRRHPHAAVK